MGGDIYNYVRQGHTNPEKYGNMMKEVAGYAKVGLIDPNGSATDINNVYVTNPDLATAQRISTAGQNQNDNNRVSSRFIEDGSYLRLKSISLTYNFPKKLLEKSKVFQTASLSLTGRDLFYFYRSLPDNINPEGTLGTGNAQGLEYASYPTTRSFLISLRFGL